MTQDFHLSVTPVGQNGYLVRTEKVASGVPLAEELVNWPVAEWLSMAAKLMEDPLQSVLQGDVISRSTAVSLVVLGQELYNALFQGSLRDSWIIAQGVAQNHQQVLKLRLGLKDSRLARLPWELMHVGDRPLATGPYITFARYQSGASNPSPPLHNIAGSSGIGILKVLMVISSPTDKARLHLLQQEVVNLQTELYRKVSKQAEVDPRVPEIELSVLDQPGREELTQALEQGRYHILHYSGHSNLGPNGGQIYLVSQKTGLTETLSGDDLAGLLVNNNIQMAVFNSCLGAYRAKSEINEETAERNLTESLVKRGVKSVLAMSERIPDEVALTLTQLFYRNLSQGYSLDLCVTRVRQGLISAYGSQQIYWVLPILYLQREFDGCLLPQANLSGYSDLLNECQPPTKPINNGYRNIANSLDVSLDLEDILNPNLDDIGEDHWLDDDSWDDGVDNIGYDDPSYQEDMDMVSDIMQNLQGQVLDSKVSRSEDATMQTELVKQIPINNLNDLPVKNINDTVPWRVRIVTTPANIEKSTVNTMSSGIFSPENHRRTLQNKQTWSVIGISAIAVFTGIGLLWLQSSSSRNITDVPSLSNQNLTNRKNNNQNNINLSKANTGIVTATATAQFSQGNLQAGMEAVEELLNRAALPSAEIALNLVPAQESNHPSVNFYRGRLAWQFVQIGNNKYSVDDARRYWVEATKKQPDSLLYNNALGFAYYAEDNLNYANDAWLQALNFALKRGENQGSVAMKYAYIAGKPETLTSYAGLALGLYKSAKNETGEKKQRYLQEAIKLRQLVIQNAPSDFTIEKLSQNWLWTEQAITDWRSLLAEN
ncbi:CHAT domain-containing protein [Anabaena sp. FACHB-1237]|uniref:cell division protein HetF n=1 Tax=Anabaena sp. FACHB-1237 TaxID=2692769 RepID=UPI001680517A|nr:cell division protein HetF [Anabaena sp. FACHB-1237]MBD2136972.1 CHAT domain-containing protein [Anabaena sp. FACHB-1237]